jgi:hypothetical protein
MASHFKWYPADSEIVVPFNARYAFPSQANKAIKMTPRIPPKNQGTFSPGNVIRLEFPAQGYVNPGKTTLEFDVEMIYDPVLADQSYLRFQNNIQSIFSRVRLLYGATPLEDIPYYNVVTRLLTEWTTSSSQEINQTSISEGIGGTHMSSSGQFSAIGGNGSGLVGPVNTRQKAIHGVGLNGVAADASGSTGFGMVPNGPTAITVLSPTTKIISGKNPVRRYQVQLNLGLFNQEKLIPTKWMASQLAIEITLATPNECMYYVSGGTPTSAAPSYAVSQVNLIPEILEFDASYDESFLRGLQQNGIPIKMSTWNHYRFSNGSNASSFNLQIQERSRSVKAIFAVQRRDPPTFGTDSGAAFFTTAANSSLQEFQFRIGGRYFPAQPVQNTIGASTSIPNGGCESYVELQKALNTLGDYRLSTSVNTLNWAMLPDQSGRFPEYDYDYGLVRFEETGAPVTSARSSATTCFAGDIGSGCFAMATDLETSNGLEISGLNAEEQSDISLIARYSSGQSSGFVFDVFTLIDTMLVLKENNVLELIQ